MTKKTNRKKRKQIGRKEILQGRTRKEAKSRKHDLKGKKRKEQTKKYLEYLYSQN